MEHELRLADRQGLLRGSDLSEVQVQGSEILMIVEDVRSWKENQERQITNLKLGLLTRQESNPEKLFPELFGLEEEDDEDSDDVEYDYSRVEWKSPKDMDEEQRDVLMAMVQRGAARMDIKQAEQSSGEWV